MFEQEYDGPAFEDCPIVIQLYPKTSHKEAISPFVWVQMYNAVVQSDTPQESFFVQLSGKSKVRLGFTSHDMPQRWFHAVHFDLDKQGILSKDKRTNKRMSDIFNASDTDGSVSSRSSAVSSSLGHSQPDQNVMVLYNVPFWMEDDHLAEALKTKNKILTSVNRLNWTMGDISLAA